jgi:hypothetical protein
MRYGLSFSEAVLAGETVYCLCGEHPGRSYSDNENAGSFSAVMHWVRTSSTRDENKDTNVEVYFKSAVARRRCPSCGRNGFLPQEHPRLRRSAIWIERFSGLGYEEDTTG